MRGDGPTPRQRRSRTRRCSPHARGWTVPEIDVVLPPGVFPACAGMDRLRLHAGADDVGVPRMRGDGPALASASVSLLPCSPHARGWTERHSTGPHHRLVFPACAGMDRERASAIASDFSVPRMRGDGPTVGAMTVSAAKCSPHARGWTDGAQLVVAAALVFPACAGMDRQTVECGSDRRGVPRMRGDGPSSLSLKHCGQMCSPHARGWTVDRAESSRVSHVFPACAGMDRRLSTGGMNACGVPRMRGDGPR